MRILYISQYFPPEVGATQTRAVEMAGNLVRQGHQVTVLTEFPNHPAGIIPPAYRRKLFQKDEYNGIRVIRTWVFARPQKTFVTRMGFYLSFMVMGFFAGLFLKGPFDVVYTTSPPFFTGLTGLFLSRLKRARFVFEVRDLWPQSAVELGELQNQRFIRWAEWLEKKYYDRADKIIAVTRGIYDSLRERGYEKKTELVPNGTNTELFYNTGPVKRELLAGDAGFVVLYAGILGLAQGMEQLCEVAEKLKDDRDVRFVFIGEGPMKEKVNSIKNRKQLDNLLLLGQVSREEIPRYLSSADVCLVPLKKNSLFLGALPSKMFDCMACERPIILSVDGEARRVLERAGAGLYVEPGNSNEMVTAIKKLRSNPALCREMGVRGRRFVERHFSRRQQALQLEHILLDL